MGALSISRRRFVTAGAMGSLGVLLAPEAVLADDQPELLRWDLVSIRDGVIVAGGTDVATDATSGDTISLTGSGGARTDDSRATGGGTFEHHVKNGPVRKGVYFVTSFVSWENLGGSLVGIPLTDGIESLKHTTGGKLFLRVHLVADAGETANGLLGVHCHLPGSRPAVEGITLNVDGTALHFTQTSGATLFHGLED